MRDAKAEVCMPLIANVLCLSVLIFIESVQLLIYAGTLLGYQPAGQTAFYAAFLCCVLGAHMWALWFFRQKLNDNSYFLSWIPFILTEGVLVFWQLSALWQMIVYGSRSPLAWRAYMVVLILSVLNKIFWPKIRQAGVAVSNFIFDPQRQAVLRPIADALCLLLIALIIYVPDPEASLAKMFFGEHFGHYDFTIMGPAYASLSGNLLFVDTMSTYGFGMPWILARVAQYCLGGFNDLSIFIMVVCICIVVYLFYYGLLRFWLKSIMLALAAVLVCIKMQMFYSFAYPLTFTYPDSCAVRFCTDIFFWAAILMHLRTHRPIFLGVAACCTGFSIFFILSTGMDLLMALYAYMAMHLVTGAYRRYVCPSPSAWWVVVCFYLLPIVVALGFYVAAAGHYALTASFWQNIGQMHGLFLDGFFNNLIYFHPLRIGEYWNAWMSLIIPTVLVLTMLIVMVEAYMGAGPYENLLLLPIAVYGLSMFQHYVDLPVGNNYYMRALPFVFIFFHWINRALSLLPDLWRRRAALAILGIAAYALCTNHIFISHPNVFNLSRNPMVDPLVAEPLPDGRPYFNHKEGFINETYLVPLNSLGEKDQGFHYEYEFPDDETLKQYYRKESDFSIDAKFIANLTNAGDKVVLISNYDWRILAAAKRRPFFYAFPLFESRPMRARSFAHTALYHKDFLNRELQNLETFKPEYVFIQRMYLTNDLPQAYYKDYEDLIALINYVKKHYAPYKEGYYLSALKRVEG